MSAVIFSVPEYIPDPTSGEELTGYQVQRSSVTNSPSLILPNSSFSDITGSPFTSNQNIVDVAGTVNSWYRVKPLRTITVGNTSYTLDGTWSKPFQYNTPMYDARFTRVLLPTLRFTYLGDQGIHNTNGTALLENTGAGAGLFVFDGVTSRFNLQYISDSDPILLLDDAYNLILTPHGGSPSVLTLNVDYAVDPRSGILEFATPPPANTDYVRFEFRRTDFVNSDLLQCLASAVNALTQYGSINGYQVNTNNNLMFINKPLQYPDLNEIICKIAMLRLRDGLTEAAMRGTTAWRDGNSSVDPYPSRALEFLMGKSDLNDKQIRNEINSFVRNTTTARHRGEYEVFYDLSSLVPMVSGMMIGLPGMYGGIGGGVLSGSMNMWYT